MAKQEHTNSNQVNRRRFIAGAGVGAIAGLAGCTSGDQSDNTDTPAGNNGGGSTSTSQTSTPSIEGPIKLGMLGPMQTATGQDAYKGAQMAAEEINNNGGVYGANIQIVKKDSKNDPATAKQKYRELVLQDQVDVTTGGWLGAVIQNILPTITQQDKLHFLWGADMSFDSGIADNYDKYRNIFRTFENSVQAANNRFNIMKDVFNAQGYENIGLVYEDLSWNTRHNKYFDKHAPSEFNVKVSTRVPYDTNDFSSLYDRLENKNVEAIYGFMAVIGTPAVVQWARQQRQFSLFGSIVSMSGPSFWNQTDGETRFGAGNAVSIPGVAHTDMTVPFQETFYSRHDHYPVLNGYHGYGIVRVYAEAIRQAGSMELDALISALEDLTMKTTLGPLDFMGQDGKWPHNAIQDTDHLYQQAYQWQQKDGKGINEDKFYPNSGGVQECIWPQKDATQAYIEPSWVQ